MHRDSFRVRLDIAAHLFPASSPFGGCLILAGLLVPRGFASAFVGGKNKFCPTTEVPDDLVTTASSISQCC